MTLNALEGIASPVGGVRQPRPAHANGGIRAISEAIAGGVVPDREVREHAKHIEQESVRLSETMNDLFEMSKINAGAVQLSQEKVALDEVVDDVLAAYKIASVALRATLPRELWVIGNDRALCACCRIWSRTLAHTPSGGSVELALGADENGAFARVDDTGVGTDETDLPRVFDVAHAALMDGCTAATRRCRAARGWAWCRPLTARCRPTISAPGHGSRSDCRWQLTKPLYLSGLSTNVVNLKLRERVGRWPQGCASSISSGSWAGRW